MYGVWSTRQKAKGLLHGACFFTGSQNQIESKPAIEAEVMESGSGKSVIIGLDDSTGTGEGI
jgi:hypothetical protein